MTVAIVFYIVTVLAFLMGVLFGRMMCLPHDSERSVDRLAA